MWAIVSSDYHVKKKLKIDDAYLRERCIANTKLPPSHPPAKTVTWAHASCWRVRIVLLLLHLTYLAQTIPFLFPRSVDHTLGITVAAVPVSMFRISPIRGSLSCGQRRIGWRGRQTNWTAGKSAANTAIATARRWWRWRSLRHALIRAFGAALFIVAIWRLVIKRFVCQGVSAAHAVLIHILTIVIVLIAAGEKNNKENKCEN